MFVIIALLLFLFGGWSDCLDENGFKWICRDSHCQRLSIGEKSENVVFPTVELCRLTCGSYGALWPKPLHLNMADRNLFVFNPSQITFRSNQPQPSSLYRHMIEIFRNNLQTEYANCSSHTDTKLVININILSRSEVMNWNTDESYSLLVNPLNDKETQVFIEGNTTFGARHALETLSQLMTSFPVTNNHTCLAMVKKVETFDMPAFTHRGLLLDTSRNFLSLKTIKKHIKAMAASKLNFLHWHITDSHSFPMETPRVPNMTIYGAYSRKKVYQYEDIKGIVQYALYRGVRILFEFDAPSHAGYGWQWAPAAGLGNLTVCLNHQPWREACVQPPCGQLNPANHNVYDVLKRIYSDIVDLYPYSEIFHMGGDELFLPCWNSSEEILRYIGSKPRTTETFLDLWAEFQREALNRYDRAVGHNKSKIVIWTSHLTDPEYVERYVPKNRYVIQTWVPNTDDLPDQLLSKGYKLIISTKNAWYLDHGFWGKTEYYDWRKVYENVIPLTAGVLGGEVCMWGEYVDDCAVLGRTWPRAAAAAERLWSNPTDKSTQVEPRFYRHRERLVTRGIAADAVIPKWCYYNEGQC